MNGTRRPESHLLTTWPLGLNSQTSPWEEGELEWYLYLISVVARMAHEMEEEQVLSIRNKVDDTLTIQCHFLNYGSEAASMFTVTYAAE